MQSFLNFVQPFIDFSHSTAFLWLLIGSFVIYIIVDKAIHRKALTELRELREANKKLKASISDKEVATDSCVK